MVWSRVWAEGDGASTRWDDQDNVKAAHFTRVRLTTSASGTSIPVDSEKQRRGRVPLFSLLPHARVQLISSEAHTTHSQAITSTTSMSGLGRGPGGQGGMSLVVRGANPTTGTPESATGSATTSMPIRRRGYGVAGVAIRVYTNHFVMGSPIDVIYHYDGTLSLDLSSTN